MRTRAELDNIVVIIIVIIIMIMRDSDLSEGPGLPTGGGPCREEKGKKRARFEVGDTYHLPFDAIPN